jgi:hypothetical protein
MSRKRPNEPIAPTTIPGERLDPKIPDEDLDSDESEQEQQARESEKAFDQAVTRTPPG